MGIIARVLCFAAAVGVFQRTQPPAVRTTECDRRSRGRRDDYLHSTSEPADPICAAVRVLGRLGASGRTGSKGEEIMRYLVKISCFWALVASSALGQGDRGTITGTVTDPSGAVVAGARVTAENADTHNIVETVTTGTGNFTLPQVPVGRGMLLSKPRDLRGSRH
jgi:hypothetical protein